MDSGRAGSVETTGPERLGKLASEPAILSTLPAIPEIQTGGEQENAMLAELQGDYRHVLWGLLYLRGGNILEYLGLDSSEVLYLRETTYGSCACTREKSQSRAHPQRSKRGD